MNTKLNIETYQKLNNFEQVLDAIQSSDKRLACAVFTNGQYQGTDIIPAERLSKLSERYDMKNGAYFLYNQENREIILRVMGQNQETDIQFSDFGFQNIITENL